MHINRLRDKIKEADENTDCIKTIWRVFQLCALLEGWLMLQAKVAFALHQRDLPLEVLGLLLFVAYHLPHFG